MAAKLSKRQQDLLVWFLYGAGLVPALFEFYLGATDNLGGDPVKIFERFLGLWTVRFLILGLAVTPLRDLANVNLLRYRRALGLLAFYYASFHLAAYLLLDLSMQFSILVEDVIKRPFITFGMIALIALVPLALTSNNASIRRLGANWNKLHKLVYPAVALGTLHYSMSVKVLNGEQWLYISLVILLLAYRIVRRPILNWKKARRLQATA